MIIKKADKNDAEKLYDMCKLMGSETTLEAMRENIGKDEREILHIAYDGDYAIGYCTGLIISSVCNRDSRMDVEWLFVREAYRNKGVGGDLIKSVEKEAVSKNVLHFHISTGTENDAAKALYLKMGYNDAEEMILDKTLHG